MKENRLLIPLGEVVKFQRGFDITKAQQKPGFYPVISSGGIGSYHEVAKLKGPGVVIGRKGTLGTVFFSAGDYWPHDTTLWARDFHDNDPKFLYYFLKTLKLEQYDSGASNPTLNRNHIHTLMVAIPGKKAQYRIAAVLSAYDDLIENNTRRIQVLEEMAQALYREWFVNFRFPGHEKSRMVESEMGLIPEGWCYTLLLEALAELESGSRPKGGIDASQRGIPSIGAENINGLGKYSYNKEKYVSYEFYQRMNRGHVKSGDVLLYKDGAHIGKKALFRDGFPHKVCCINEHVFILRSNARVTQSYLYFWLDQPHMTTNIRNLNANAAQPGINQGGVNGLPLLVPAKAVLNAWEAIAAPLLAELFNLAKKNNNLRQTRDHLLPKLISGEVDVVEL